MENTIIIAIVSLLCILAHVPTLILRIVPFHEKISDKDRIRPVSYTHLTLPTIA